ncbi:hypothetical protein LTS18_013268 [Coniosporium uncinatum]|uniref:Uncharacterized protein n=1 Tax=Coniosporium uncinatum TaxID=93489 RepID=A0ACC3DIP2_9PEZI|nr:hypothetical protein LTS18_013268 [Coniosporium uncinatum]
MSQLLAMFVKVVRKISSHFRGLVEGEVAKGLPQAERADDGDEESAGVDGEARSGGETKKERRFRALEQDLAEELKEGGKEVNDAERERIRSIIDSLPLDKYEQSTAANDWEDAERQVRTGKGGGTVAVKSGKAQSVKRKAGEALAEAHKEEEKFREGKKGKKGRR